MSRACTHDHKPPDKGCVNVMSICIFIREQKLKLAISNFASWRIAQQHEVSHCESQCIDVHTVTCVSPANELNSQLGLLGNIYNTDRSKQRAKSADATWEVAEKASQ